MRTFTIHLSADATAMLDEMRSIHGVKPQDVIRVIVEGMLADAFTDAELFRTILEHAARPQASARDAWKTAREVDLARRGERA
jgi:hypothetical protein